MFFRMDQKGAALIIALIFLGILSLLAGWAILQSTTGIKIAGAIKQYNITFNLADGDTNIAINYLRSHTPSSPKWNPSKEADITQGVPSYFKNKDLPPPPLRLPRVPARHQPFMKWKGYDTTPLPGWMLNWQGYSQYYRIQYIAGGRGESQVNSTIKTEIDAILLKITR